MITLIVITIIITIALKIEFRCYISPFSHLLAGKLHSYQQYGPKPNRPLFLYHYYNLGYTSVRV